MSSQVQSRVVNALGICLGILFPWLLCQGRGWAQEFDLKTMVDLQRAAVQAIRSVSCDVHVRPTDPNVAEATARYVRSGDDVFVRYRRAGRIRECAVHGQTIKGYSRIDQSELPAKANGAVGLDRYQGQEVTECDIWAIGLLCLPLANDPFYKPLEELLKLSRKISHPYRIAQDNRNLVAIEIESDHEGMISQKWTGTIIFDPKANWLVRQIRWTNAEMTRTFEVLDFHEAAPGIFFPTRVERRLLTPKQPEKTLFTLTASHVVVNRPVAPASLTLSIPAGTTVFDRIQGTTYEIGADGKPRTPPQPMPDTNSLKACESVESPNSMTLATDREPSSWTSYLLPVSVLLLAFVGLWKCLQIVRMRQS